MKDCVYCQQRIEDDAIVCKYCTRQAPQRAVSLEHPGRHFGLGRTTTAYAIWDLTSSTPPLAEFDLTTEGWDDAWYRFQRLEHDPDSVQEAPADDVGTPVYPTFPLVPDASSSDDVSGRYTVAAWICAGLAVLLPVPFGPLGIALGITANAKGDPRGRPAIIGSVIGTLTGLLVLAFVLR